jgi:hypothetical protein
MAAGCQVRLSANVNANANANVNVNVNVNPIVYGSERCTPHQPARTRTRSCPDFLSGTCKRRDWLRADLRRCAAIAGIVAPTQRGYRGFHRL